MKSTMAMIHNHFIFSRRIEVLVNKLKPLVPAGASVLDVGTGDGQIASMIAEKSPNASVAGIDIMLRPTTHVAVTLFDGIHIPHPDNSFDVVTFVDVLHHTSNPAVLIKEAARVAKQTVLIKDHLSENILDQATLRVMDWVGNAPHNVVLPYNYAARAEWMQWFDDANLQLEVFDLDVPLYAFPLSAVFGRGLHFVAALQPAS